QYSQLSIGEHQLGADMVQVRLQFWEGHGLNTSQPAGVSVGTEAELGTPPSVLSAPGAVPNVPLGPSGRIPWGFWDVFVGHFSGTAPEPSQENVPFSAGFWPTGSGGTVWTVCSIPRTRAAWKWRTWRRLPASVRRTVRWFRVASVLASKCRS